MYSKFYIYILYAIYYFGKYTYMDVFVYVWIYIIKPCGVQIKGTDAFVIQYTS